MFGIEHVEKQKNRNLKIMWLANFCVAGSMTMILPFLSLLIDSYGEHPEEFVQRWAGLVFGVTFVTAFIFSPIWGRIGDKFGRKKVLMCLGFGVSISVLLMGMVSNVYILFLLRAFMGLFAGFISMSQALIAAQTEKAVAGRVLGSLQTGNVSGALFGPLIGGLLADAFGFHYTFIITAIVTAIAATLVWLGIQEVRVEEEDNGRKGVPYSAKEVLGFIFRSPIVLMIMIVSTLIQVANFSIQPLLALYVSQLHDQAANIALLSGLAFSATGLGNLLFTRQWGKLGDRIGYGKIMFILLALSAVLFIPQAFVNAVWQLVILRFLLGIVMGGLIPCRAAYIRQVAPLSIQGEVMGYMTSFRFLGNVIGPVMGGFLAAWYGIGSVFYVTSFLFFISAAIIYYTLRKEKEAAQKDDDMRDHRVQTS